MPLVSTNRGFVSRVAEESPEYFNIIIAIIDRRMQSFVREYRTYIRTASSRFNHPLLRHEDLRYIFTWDCFGFTTIQGIEPLITNLVGAQAESLGLAISCIVTQDTENNERQSVVLHLIDTPPTHLFSSMLGPRLISAHSIPWH